MLNLHCSPSGAVGKLDLSSLRRKGSLTLIDQWLKARFAVLSKFMIKYLSSRQSLGLVDVVNTDQ